MAVVAVHGLDAAQEQRDVGNDLLGIAAESTLKRCLLAEGDRHVLFTGMVVKVNRRGWRQKRVMVITEGAVYNFVSASANKLSSYQRRFPHEDIRQIFVVEDSTEEFILHSKTQYDYRFCSAHRSKIIEVICEAHAQNLQHEVEVVQLPAETVAALFVTKLDMVKRLGMFRRGGAKRQSTLSLPPGALSRHSSSDTTDSMSEVGSEFSFGTASTGPVSEAESPTSGAAVLPPYRRVFRFLRDTFRSHAANQHIQAALAIPSSCQEDTAVVLAELCMYDDCMHDFLTVLTESQHLMVLKLLLDDFIRNCGGIARYWLVKVLHKLEPVDPFLSVVESIPLLLDAEPFDVQLYYAFVELVVGTLQQPPSSLVLAVGQATASDTPAPSTPSSSSTQPEAAQGNAMNKAGGKSAAGADLSTVVRKHEPIPPVEVFGKSVKDPLVLAALMEMVGQVATPDLQHRILKDFNMLLLRKDCNVDILLTVRNWQVWFCPIFGHIPMELAHRSNEQDELLKFVLNVFGLVHLRAFKSEAACRIVAASLSTPTAAEDAAAAHAEVRASGRLDPVDTPDAASNRTSTVSVSSTRTSGEYQPLSAAALAQSQSQLSSSSSSSSSSVSTAVPLIGSPASAGRRSTAVSVLTSKSDQGGTDADTHLRPFRRLLYSTIFALDDRGGWCRETVHLVRTLLNVILNKIRSKSGLMQWRHDFERCEWRAMLDFADVLREFIFFTPVQDADGHQDGSGGGLGAASLSNVEHHGRGSVAQRPHRCLLRPYGSVEVHLTQIRADTDRLGLHLDSTTSASDDLPLAQRMLEVLKTLMTNFDEAEMQDMPRDALAACRQARTCAEAFEEYVTLLKSVNAGEYDEEAWARACRYMITDMDLCRPQSTGHVGKRLWDKFQSPSVRPSAVQMARKLHRRVQQVEALRMLRDRSRVNMATKPRGDGNLRSTSDDTVSGGDMGGVAEQLNRRQVRAGSVEKGPDGDRISRLRMGSVARRPSFVCRDSPLMAAAATGADGPPSRNNANALESLRFGDSGSGDGADTAEDDTSATAPAGLARTTSTSSAAGARDKTASFASDESGGRSRSGSSINNPSTSGLPPPPFPPSPTSASPGPSPSSSPPAHPLPSTATSGDARESVAARMRVARVGHASTVFAVDDKPASRHAGRGGRAQSQRSGSGGRKPAAVAADSSANAPPSGPPSLEMAKSTHPMAGAEHYVGGDARMLESPSFGSLRTTATDAEGDAGEAAKAAEVAAHGASAATAADVLAAASSESVNLRERASEESLSMSSPRNSDVLSHRAAAEELNDMLLDADVELASAICQKCEEPIEGGVTEAVCAMDGYWHPACFHCAGCDAELTSVKGGQYFELHDEAYCGKCFAAQFARHLCASCFMPFTDSQRIIEVEGHRWHVEHFTCCQCATPLTSSAGGCHIHDTEPYCVDCFNRCIACCPRCNQVVSAGDNGSGNGAKATQEDGSGFVIGNRAWHADCIRCEDCDEPLLGKQLFMGPANSEFTGSMFCETHYRARFLPKCALCKCEVEDGITACNQQWHAACFKCSRCGCELGRRQFFEKNHAAYCEPCYTEAFMASCASCKKALWGEYVEAHEGGHVYHTECFCCTVCRAPFEGSEYYLDTENRPYCPEHGGASASNESCAYCNLPLFEEHLDHVVRAGEFVFHPHCVRCTVCKEEIQDTSLHILDGHLLCEEHYMAELAADSEFVCFVCQRGIVDGGLKIGDRYLHQACLCCTVCRQPLDASTGVLERDEKLFCSTHYAELVAPRCEACNKPIMDRFAKLQDAQYHVDCVKCFNCSKALAGQKLVIRGGLLGCPRCHTLPRDELTPEGQAHIQQAETRSAAARAAADAADAAPPPPPPAAAAAAADDDEPEQES